MSTSMYGPYPPDHSLSTFGGACPATTIANRYCGAGNLRYRKLSIGSGIDLHDEDIKHPQHIDRM